MVDDITKGTIMAVSIVAIILIPLLMTVESRFSFTQKDNQDNRVNSQATDAKIVQDVGNAFMNYKQLLRVANDEQTMSELSKGTSDKNPEQLLRDAYNKQAIEELDRCLGSGHLEFLCENDLKLLVETCKDPTLHVEVCDDPRLAKYSKPIG